MPHKVKKGNVDGLSSMILTKNQTNKQTKNVHIKKKKKTGKKYIKRINWTRVTRGEISKQMGSRGPMHRRPSPLPWASAGHQPHILSPERRGPGRG